ncbi:hypothetical protein B0E52_15210 [Rhodanobacter sp. C06]|uniref:DUF4386 domain-containing protein n=1 Tax=Rhodanobacter sp. C06 TaxID=1945854 RepID=UPI000984F89A|nr:DUF4386 domain-containing protein [Rhodanobacter sp. C06]OOG37626.1 hypothetical protein B0E52_15210 [Rhodanobacter sp. C06]
MNRHDRNARLAGSLYLLVVLVAPYRLLYVPNVLFVDGNAAATAANIAEHETLFRLGIAGDLFTGTISVLLALALYRLLSGVDRKLATVMVALGVWDTPFYFFNALNDAAALTLAHGAGFLAAFNEPQRDALAMLFLHLHGQFVVFAETFWGLWLIPLALLMYRSGFLPRLLGVWLFFNGLAYMAQSIAGVLLPSFEDTLSNIAFPLQFGEVAFMLWLLVMGARRGFRRTPTSPANA